jgi:MoaD family protein
MEITGKKEEAVNFPDCKAVTVNIVVRRLAESFGKDFVEYVYNTETSGVREFLQFLVNGRNASIINGLETELKDGDVLSIITPVEGG